MIEPSKPIVALLRELVYGNVCILCDKISEVHERANLEEFKFMIKPTMAKLHDSQMEKRQL